MPLGGNKISARSRSSPPAASGSSSSSFARFLSFNQRLNSSRITSRSPALNLDGSAASATHARKGEIGRHASRTEAAHLPGGIQLAHRRADIVRAEEAGHAAITYAGLLPNAELLKLRRAFTGKISKFRVTRDSVRRPASPSRCSTRPVDMLYSTLQTILSSTGSGWLRSPRRNFSSVHRHVVLNSAQHPNRGARYWARSRHTANRSSGSVIQYRRCRLAFVRLGSRKTLHTPSTGP